MDFFLPVKLQYLPKFGSKLLRYLIHRCPLFFIWSVASRFPHPVYQILHKFLICIVTSASFVLLSPCFSQDWAIPSVCITQICKQVTSVLSHNIPFFQSIMSHIIATWEGDIGPSLLQPEKGKGEENRETLLEGIWLSRELGVIVLEVRYDHCSGALGTCLHFY